MLKSFKKLNLSLDKFLTPRLPLLLANIIFFQIVIFAVASLTSQFSVSEIWSITTANDLWSLDKGLYTVWSRLTFYFLLNPVSLIFDENVKILIFSRLIFFALGLVALYLVFKILMMKTKSITLALLTVSLLLSNYYFFTRGFRIRSDILAMTLNLILYDFFFREIQKENIKVSMRWLLSGLSLLLLMSTPKSIYIYTANLIFFYFLLKQNKMNAKQIRSVLSSLFISPIVFMVLIIFTTKYVFNFEYFYEAYVQAFSYYISGFNTSFIHYIWDKWPLVFFMLFIYVISHFFILKKNKMTFKLWQNLEPYIFLCISIFVILVIHNQKYPFFIASYMPVLYLSIAAILSHIVFRWSSFLVLLLAIGGVCYSSMVILKIQKNTTLHQQIQFITNFERHLNQNPSVKYIDGAGLLPKNNSYPYYFGPDEIHQPQWFEAIKEISPDIILFTPRMTALEPLLSYWLKRNYHNQGPDVWFKCVDFMNYPKSVQLAKRKRIIKVTTEDFLRIIKNELGVEVQKVLISWDFRGLLTSKFKTMVKIAGYKSQDWSTQLDLPTLYANLKYNESLEMPYNVCITRLLPLPFSEDSLVKIFSYDNY